MGGFNGIFIGEAARGERSWDVRFHHDFNDWEMELVAAFLLLLESHIPSVGGDHVRWKLMKRREFDIRSFL